MIVHESKKKELIDELSKRVKSIVIGDPKKSETHVGPLCTIKQIELIEKTIDKAVSQGANVVFGGSRIKQKGYYFEPTLIDCPNEQYLWVHMKCKRAFLVYRLVEWSPESCQPVLQSNDNNQQRILFE